MTVLSIILIFLLYRSYLFYKKRTDFKMLAESQKIYLNDFFPKHFTYFTYLNEEEKQEFIIRALHIREQLKINASSDLLVSENVKTLISAAYTQITFGFDNYYLGNFNRIFLHPGIFYSRFIDRDVKGLTFGNGIIHWSWDDFVKGYMYSDDKINLALHELAHALQLESFENQEVETPYYDAWVTYAEIELAEMKAHPEKAYFRAYASTNIHEFFAVAVEYFFEDPINFREQRGILYQATSKVLMQDMAERISPILNSS